MRLSLLAGRWRYTERGILDRTHTHLFTRATLVETVEGAGYRVVELDHTAPVPRLGTPAVERVAHAVAGVRPSLFAYQFLLVALPVISVVIPVKNGGADLVRCLDAIARQVVDEPVEVVVVDSGSDRRERRPRAGARRARPRDPARGVRPRAHPQPRGRALVGRPRRLHVAGRRRCRRALARATRRRGPRRRTTSPARTAASSRTPTHDRPRSSSSTSCTGRTPAPSASRPARSSASRRRSSRTSTRPVPRAVARPLPVSRRPDDERGPGVVASRASRGLRARVRAAARPSGTRTRTRSPSAFRRFFDSGVSAEHAYVEGDASRAALRRAGGRYAARRARVALAHRPAALDPVHGRLRARQVRRAPARAPPPAAPARARDAVERAPGAPGAAATRGAGAARRAEPQRGSGSRTTTTPSFATTVVPPSRLREVGHAFRVGDDVAHAEPRRERGPLGPPARIAAACRASGSLSTKPTCRSPNAGSVGRRTRYGTAKCRHPSLTISSVSGSSPRSSLSLNERRPETAAVARLGLHDTLRQPEPDRRPRDDDERDDERGDPDDARRSAQERGADQEREPDADVVDDALVVERHVRRARAG